MIGGVKTMPKRLAKTNVVIVGMGAAGGVVALPLTNAGLKVIGIEAGGWLSPRDFAPDELRNGSRTGPSRCRRRRVKRRRFVRRRMIRLSRVAIR